MNLNSAYPRFYVLTDDGVSVYNLNSFSLNTTKTFSAIGLLVTPPPSAVLLEIFDIEILYNNPSVLCLSVWIDSAGTKWAILLMLSELLLAKGNQYALSPSVLQGRLPLEEHQAKVVFLVFSRKRSQVHDTAAAQPASSEVSDNLACRSQMFRHSNIRLLPCILHFIIDL